MTYLYDLRLAVRRWKSRPAFAATAIATLGLGIAATTAIFSVVDAVLLKALPWRDADRLVAVYVARPHWRLTPVLSGSWNIGNLSWPIFEDLRTKSGALSEIAVWNRARLTLNGERNEMVHGLRVSSGFFPMLGVTPFIGGFFTPGDDTAPTSSVIVSYEAWQRRFGGTPAVLGQQVSLNERPYAVVGVLPPGFNFTGVDAAEFVLPLGNVPSAERNAGNHFLYGVARLAAGVRLEQAVAEADPLVRGSEQPDEKQARLVPLAEDQLGRTRRPLWFLLGAAGLLLLIACTNVAGLLVGEAGARRYEMAVRLAIGAARRDVVRQLFVESLALAFAAMMLALLLVIWLTPLLGSLAPAELPRVGTVALNARVFGFGLIVGVLTIVVFGIAPALTIGKVDPARWMHGGSRGSSRRRYGAHNALVIAEVALAVMLVAAASLFSETLLRLTSMPLGFRPENLVVASLLVPRDLTSTPEMRARRNEDLAAALAALPGIEAAAFTSSAPFGSSYGTNTITLLDHADEKADASRHVVSESYFRTLGMAIVKGRGFDRSDRAGDYAAVVNEEFERRFMKGDAVSRRFTFNRNVHHIVGVVAATRHRQYREEAGPAFYVLHRQVPTWTTAQFIVRATSGATVMPAVRKTIESFEPLASIATLETLGDAMRRSVADERYRATLSVVFGATALLLATMGLYGLIARAVAERRREIGVRVALGAPRRAVMALVLRHAMVLVVVGVAVGIPLALAASQLFAALLYGVAATAPHTFVLASVLLGGTALAAALVPARRAAEVDPVIALRAD
jgi:putative ABC transport system permease protein